MIPQTKWFERKFSPIEDLGLLPNIIERLNFTPLRIENKIKYLKEEFLTEKIGDSWSINEEIGHLLDLEPLWYGRVNDIIKDQGVLREADLLNTKTHEANHNEMEISALLFHFNFERHQLIQLMSKLSSEQLHKVAIHPRLNMPMRVIDLAFFVAEHDDHHLAKMTAIGEYFSA